MDTLGSQAKIMVGSTPAAQSHAERVRYVRLGDISDEGRIDGASDGPAPTRGLEARLQRGDVVVRARGNPAAAAVEESFEGAYPTNDVIVIRCEGPTDAAYIAAILNLPATRDALTAESQGVVMPRLSVSTLSQLEVPAPPPATQRLVAEIAECARAERDAMKRMQELRWRLSQELLRRAAEKARDEGCAPRRGTKPGRRSKERSPLSHVSKE